MHNFDTPSREYLDGPSSEPAGQASGREGIALAENQEHSPGKKSRESGDLRSSTTKPQHVIRKPRKTDDFTTRVPRKSRTTTEGLEAQTRRVVEALQLHGRLTFDEILSLTGIDHRRLYDILNTLATTPFVTKIGKKREPTPYVWADGKPLPEPVRLDSLLFLIEAEQQACLELLAELYGR